VSRNRPATKYLKKLGARLPGFVLYVRISTIIFASDGMLARVNEKSKNALSGYLVTLWKLSAP
jgi:hypothetical protein